MISANPRLRVAVSVVEGPLRLVDVGLEQRLVLGNLKTDNASVED